MERSDRAGRASRPGGAQRVRPIAERELLLGADVAGRPRPTGCAIWASPTTPRWRRRSGPGDFDDGWGRSASALASSARDQLLVANPSYLPAASA